MLSIFGSRPFGNIDITREWNLANIESREGTMGENAGTPQHLRNRKQQLAQAGTCTRVTHRHHKNITLCLTLCLTLCITLCITLCTLMAL